LTERSHETDPRSAMARFQGKTPSTFRAPTPGIIFAIVDPGFININQRGGIAYC